MKIRELKGIGEKTEQLFTKLGIENTCELMNFYPRTYDVYGETARINNIEDEGIYAVYGIISGSPELKSAGRYRILTVMIKDEDGTPMKITWFNMPFLKNQLKRGYRYIFRGKVAFRGSLVFMEQPVIYGENEYAAKKDTLQPIYPLTAGLTNNTVLKAVKQSFENSPPEEEFLPEWIIRDCKLMKNAVAKYAIHFPKDKNELLDARKRVIFNEFFLFTTAVRSVRTANLTENNDYIIEKSDIADRVIGNLSYELTKAQKKVYAEILADMGSKRNMNRLVQGDVGSGKTILAFLAMINTAAGGFQSVLMAPTEVLARQHYEALTELITKNGLDFHCEFLAGSLTAKEKRNAKENIVLGKADFIIGTHAVITDDVEFKNLALVITDEQHRFGVKQRENLSHKGKNPHILVMSATPIPRSLAIILYGDLDISIVDEKPAERLPVKNCIVDESYRKNAYRFISNEIEKGHQAYIICAMAKESDNDELENVVEYSQKLKSEMPSEYRIEHLHGKMKPAVKTDIMERFGRGEIDILVSTTVIEVGINVPNATVMMVLNAERFGLAGLHQIRGRVGRGSDQSYCIFESNSKNKATRERLAILKESNDGFYIAEQDLKLRGPGDILGTRQSGDMGFVIGDIYADATILKMAADISNKLLYLDAELNMPENAVLRGKIKEYMINHMDKINI